MISLKYTESKCSFALRVFWVWLFMNFNSATHIKGYYKRNNKFVIIFWMRKAFWHKIRRESSNKTLFYVWFINWGLALNTEKKHQCYEINRLIFQSHLQFKLVNYHNICFAACYSFDKYLFLQGYFLNEKKIQSTQWFYLFEILSKHRLAHIQT